MSTMPEATCDAPSLDPTAPTSLLLRSANDSLIQQQPTCSNTVNMNVNNAAPPGAPVHCTKAHNSEQSVMCAFCKRAIVDKYLLEAVGKYWHEDCLRCVACQCRLGELGSTLYLKQNMILCRRDYLRLFGPTGLCAACHKNIPAFEMVMRARNNVYHLECFACQECSHRFCVGDQFYLCDNKILCQYDYNERMLFAHMFNNNYSNLQQLKEHINKQVDNLDDQMQQSVATR